MSRASESSATIATATAPGRPIALVTDFPPDAPGGGAVILRSLLRGEDRERVAWLTLSPPSGPAGDGVVALRRGSAGQGGRRSLFADSTWKAAALADEALDEARRVGARALWVVMHGAAVHVAARLVRRGGLPVHLTVHDDPAFANALRSRRYLALVPWIERDFAYAMRRADSVDVIGEGMARRYRRRYGVDPVIVHRGLDRAVPESPRYDRARRGLSVGVLGSTYSYEQLPILGRAVAKAAGRLGVPGRLVVVGRSHGDRLRAEMAGRIEVEVTGHVDEQAGIDLLRGCFLLYLNYPFARRDAVLRQTSFPTKLSTYVMAARPILMHVPADSSVMPLAEYAGYARWWGSLREDEGAELLARAWAEPSADESAHDAAERVRRRYYDLDRNRRTLLGALDALVGRAGE
jgi:glycosyltransferase involved in cell wall biosynthesis